MSNHARQEKLDDYKSGLCSMAMRCRSCICADCPRDCKECDESGTKALSSECLFVATGIYRRDKR